MAQPAHEGHDPLLPGPAGLGGGEVGWAALAHVKIEPQPGRAYPGSCRNRSPARVGLPWLAAKPSPSQGRVSLAQVEIGPQPGRGSPGSCRNRAEARARATLTHVEIGLQPGRGYPGSWQNRPPARDLGPAKSLIFISRTKKRLCPNDPSFGHSLFSIHQQLLYRRLPLFFFLGTICRGVDQLVATIGAELGRGILQALSAVGAVGFNSLRLLCSTI